MKKNIINERLNLKLLLKINIIFLLIINHAIIIYINTKKIDIDKDSLIIRLNLSKKFNKIFSILYDLARNGKLKINLKKDYENQIYTIKKNKGICACVIGKNEKLYAREYVEYYKSIGFDKIIILDNNEINGEIFENELKDYIYNKFIEIINIRDLESIQIPSYNYCYEKYNKYFDWIFFVDFDEFLYIKNNQKIDQYLNNKKFEKCQLVSFSRKNYDDNDLEKYDNRPIIKRFTRQSKTSSCTVKTIVRGGLNNLIIPSTHIFGIGNHFICNSEGERIIPKKMNHSKCSKNPNAFIKHFFSKTAEEFCYKMKRGDAHYNKMNPQYKPIMYRRIRKFFSINKRTENKLKIIEKCLHINLDKFRKKQKL